MEQEHGMQSTVNERELTRQIKKLNNQYQQQVTVNKTLSSKLMIQEKSYVDEKRLRLDLEKRLSAVLSSQPAAGPGRGASADGTSDQN